MSEVNLKTKIMLNTKDMSAGSGRPKPVMGSGNHEIRINSISFDRTPYDTEAFNIMLHVETKPVTGDFEGFYRDMNDQSKGRYDGQVGRVRMSPYPYKDATLQSGREVSRDQEVLKSMIFLSEQLDKRSQLDAIEAGTIEDFMTKCQDVFKNSEFFNACLGSREWESKEGYINDDLYLPRQSKDGVPVEALNVENSRLLVFNKDVHVRAIVKKETPKADNKFEGETGTGSDFEL
jgi:hypothetical protein|tara:strand:- start:529 stop:1230 length:702 start_codon:yes stop_codon:yes gene_type:complete